MIEVRDAVQRAINAVADLLGAAARDPRLEEVEKETIDGQPQWLITVSVARFGTIGNLDRDYKVIRLNALSGDFVSMKIREPVEPALLRR